MISRFLTVLQCCPLLFELESIKEPKINLCSCSKFPPRKYYYVDKKISWNDAQQYCREKYTDLATIESMDDISRLHSSFSYDWAWIGLDDIWIGLYRVPWTWSDKSQSSFKNWRSSSPNNPPGNQHCVVENNLHVWDDDICTIKYYSCCSILD
uniref:C-type lectin domain-containing protein n=1 Tax=Pundamilia nyererei TaxID=303518 RepID=A0A3B4G8J3_9CICH